MASIATAAPARADKPSAFLTLRIFLIVFLANMAILALQVAAVRQLAPLVGNSLDTWTAIIGMFLLGISSGNYLGGKLADRYPSERLLLVLLWLSAAGALTTMAAVALFHQLTFIGSLQLHVRIAIISFFVCFPTSFILSLITPLTIRLALPHVRSTGRIVGIIYALGTFGSLVGNFLTGFVLLNTFNLDTIIVATGCGLLLTSVFALGRTRRVASVEHLTNIAKIDQNTGSPNVRSNTPQVAELETEIITLAEEPHGASGADQLVDERTDSLDEQTIAELPSQSNSASSAPETDIREAAATVTLEPAVAEEIPFVKPVVARAEQPSPSWQMFDLSGNVVLACSIVFTASFCAMSLEMLAPRLLAPEIGLSLYSFTVIIGVCLAGIALGNFLGGLLADLIPRHVVLVTCLLLGGLAAIDIIRRFRYVQEWLEGRGIDDWQIRFLAWAGLFFLPLVFLSMVSPLVTRMTVRETKHAGRVAGLIYSFSCLGALLGIFATGWLLFSLLGGAYKMIFVIALVLLGLAAFFQVGLLFQSFLRVLQGRPLQFLGHLVALAIVAFAGGYSVYHILADKVEGDEENKSYLDSPFQLETNYYAIGVGDEWDDIYEKYVKTLVLDHLTHSYVDPSDPEYLGYEHEWVQATMTYLVAENNRNPRVLIIGGGGYTYPRWVEAKVEKASVEVVEIDPGVTRVAKDYLGLSPNSKIKTWNMDGRQFVTGRAQKKSYDLVVQDAVNDLAVPFHLMTKEYNDGIQKILKPDGIYLLTVIDKYKSGQLMRAAIRTLTKTFSQVHLLDTDECWGDYDTRSVYVIYASNRKLDMLKIAILEEVKGITNEKNKFAMWTAGKVGQLGLALGQDAFSATAVLTAPDGKTKILSTKSLNQYIAGGRQVILTDQFAPTDHLISILYTEDDPGFSFERIRTNIHRLIFGKDKEEEEEE